MEYDNNLEDNQVVLPPFSTVYLLVMDNHLAVRDINQAVKANNLVVRGFAGMTSICALETS
jgi:hypothetical protein